MSKKQTSESHIGIWMDHQHAKLIYKLPDGAYTMDIIESPFDPHPRIPGQDSDSTKWGRDKFMFSDNEHSTNNLRIKETRQYFKEIGKTIAAYSSILLTGPTTAKNELLNMLLTKKSFIQKTFSVENSDKMTDKQLIAFVNNYFSK
jgi:hypothetical protein